MLITKEKFSFRLLALNFLQTLLITCFGDWKANSCFMLSGMGKYDHVTWGTAFNQLGNSFPAVVWGLLRMSPFGCCSSFCFLCTLPMFPLFLWESTEQFQVSQSVGLVFTRSTLGSIRRSLVPLNHRFLNQALSVLWVMDFYNLCQCLVVEFSWCLQSSFLPECCCHHHGENPSPLSVFNLAAMPKVFLTF